MTRRPDPNKTIYTYEQIDELVRRYKAGDRAALDELFPAFQGYIAKFANFLCFGLRGRGDSDLHSLIRMLCPVVIVKKKKQLDYNRLQLIQTALRSYTYEDVIGELNAMFMESCLHFQKQQGGPHFVGYLYSYFKFKVKRWVDNRLKDVLNTVDIVELNDQEREMQILEDSQEFEKTFSKARPILDEVTRWIFHLHYTKGMTDREIAKIAGVRPRWIFKQRRTAIKRLRELGIEKVEALLKGTEETN